MARDKIGACMDDFDAFYAALEERFRGSYESTRSTLEVYLPVVTTAGTGTNLGPVLDLGSGRGEWLDLLREHGVPATGIDQNVKGADSAKRRGLEIEIGDIFDILPGKPSSNYGAVTAFHVIEHLETRKQLGFLPKALGFETRRFTSSRVAKYPTSELPLTVIG